MHTCAMCSSAIIKLYQALIASGVEVEFIPGPLEQIYRINKAEDDSAGQSLTHTSDFRNHNSNWVNYLLMSLNSFKTLCQVCCYVADEWKSRDLNFVDLKFNFY